MKRVEQLLIFISIMLVVITVNVLLCDIAILYYVIEFTKAMKDIGTDP